MLVCPKSYSAKHAQAMDYQDLCEGCQKIDFIDLQHSANRRQVLYRHDVCSLSYIRKDSPCPLCRFLSTLKSRELSTEITQFRLMMTRPRGPSKAWLTLKETFEKQDTLFFVDHLDRTKFPRLESTFTVSRKGFPSPTLPIFVPGTPDQCDWTQIRHWVDLCHKSHGVQCATKIISFPLSVIDCETHRIVRLPSTSTPYVTLSYVWGSGPQKDHVINRYLVDAPRTIEDSIQVVLELRYRFLWIDRYCIPQDEKNAPEKHRLIQSMGQIYGGSAMTLIAAAGEDPDYGLPGVSPGLRQVRATVQAGPWVITPQVRNPVEEVRRSMWSTRGWTYQEAWLSHRRLVFTDSQIYFQCQHMHCVESISLPMDSKSILLFNPSTKVFDSLVPGSGYSIIDHICDFIQRRFSYDCDVLDGFAGILQLFREQGKPVDNLLGLPIFNTKRHANLRLTTTDALTHALMWRCSNLLERRFEFPSWTWAGWKFEDREDNFHLSGPPLVFKTPQDQRERSLISLLVQFPARDPIGWEGHQAQIANIYQETKAQPSLVVTAFTFAFDRITIASRNRKILWSGSTRIYPKTLCVQIYPEKCQSRSFTAAVMLQHTTGPEVSQDLRCITNPSLLLMQKISDESGGCHYERIGVAERCLLLQETTEHPSLPMDLNWGELIKLKNATREKFELV